MSHDAIVSIATDARAFLAPVWEDWHRAWGGDRPAIPSENTCGRSSLFLQRALIHAGFAVEWASGVPDPSSADQKIGFFDGRTWRSHAWVECQGLVVDITADQFGAAPVTVRPAADRYEKEPGTPPCRPSRLPGRTLSLRSGPSGSRPGVRLASNHS